MKIKVLLDFGYVRSLDKSTEFAICANIFIRSLVVTRGMFRCLGFVNLRIIVREFS